jgi:hypothetical protein
MRESHAFCVKLTRAEPVQVWKSRANRVGMVPVKEFGSIMKLRGMISKLPLESPGAKASSFFCIYDSFFSFYLTGVGVFCNHHRPPIA